jgi:hypothetical protein
MGLFDGYFDPEQFQASGGLLGRLLSLQQQQGQYQPGGDFDQAPAVRRRRHCCQCRRQCRRITDKCRPYRHRLRKT